MWAVFASAGIWTIYYLWVTDIRSIWLGSVDSAHCHMPHGLKAYSVKRLDARQDAAEGMLYRAASCGVGSGQRIRRRTEKDKEGTVMGFGDERLENAKGHGMELDTVGEALMDALSLFILLENDMETHGADDVYKRAVKMLHNELKCMKKNLPIVPQTEKSGGQA